MLAVLRFCERRFILLPERMEGRPAGSFADFIRRAYFGWSGIWMCEIGRAESRNDDE